MNSNKTFIGIVAAVCCSWAAAQCAWGQIDLAGTHHQPQHLGASDRARIVISKSLSQMDGNHLKAVLLEVRYGPGEASHPHSHSCAVLGYVVEGAIRSQVQGEPEKTYKAGESFYEAPNGVHLVSANASDTEPARLLAYMICDHDAPLSVDAPAAPHEDPFSKGTTK